MRSEFENELNKAQEALNTALDELKGIREATEAMLASVRDALSLAEASPVELSPFEGSTLAGLRFDEKGPSFSAN